MREKKDGGPAYPSSNEVSVGEFVTGGHAGMTLRDYFAGQALAGMLAKRIVDYSNGFGVEESYLAYQIADAMLAERDK